MSRDRWKEASQAQPDGRWALRNGVHLLVLWGFAVVRPTLDLLSQGPDLFVTRKVDGIEFVMVVLFFAVVPPMIMLGLEAIAVLQSRRLRDGLHLTFAWGLLALFALYALKQLFPSEGAVLLVGAVLIAAAATFVYARFAPARVFFDYLAPAPAVFLVAFLFFSSSKSLIFEANAPAAEKSGAPRTPIVWVVFDELPISSLMNAHERIDAGRFPNFARFARQATWFKNAAASGDGSQEAVPAILTGKKPRARLVPTFADHPRNLFTLLAASHSVTAMEHETWLCPSETCPSEFSAPRRMYDLASAMSLVYLHAITPVRYDDRLPAIGRTWGEALSPELPKEPVDPRSTSSSELARHGDAQFERFLELIKPYRASDRPPLYFLHSSLPHTPWNYVPSGKIYASVKDRPPGLDRNIATWTTDPYLVNHGFQRHLLQTIFVDRLLGKLIRHLRQRHLYDRSLIVITADHGVSFHPGGERRWATPGNLGDVGLVPFFVKAPGQTRGRVVGRQIQSIDELPTVAQILDVPIPWAIDGISASDMGDSGRQQVSDFRHTRSTEIRAPFSQLLRQRRETVRRQIELFGTGPLTPRFYGLGRYRELTGRALSILATRNAGDLTVSLDHASDYGSVDPSSAFLPALVTGRVSGSSSAPVHNVAIAVNGRVRAVVPTHFDGQASLWAILPERALKSGANSLEVYSVTGDRERPRLFRLGG